MLRNGPGNDGQKVQTLSDDDAARIVDEQLNKARDKAKKSSAGQVKFDLVSSKLRTHFETSGELIAYSLGDWWQYSKGRWRRYSESEVEQLECLLHEICDAVEMPYASNRQHVLTHIKTTRDFLLDMSVMDSYPYVALKNGTLDVLSQTMLPHDPEHYTSRSLEIDYDPDATCPEWEQMLRNIFKSYPAETRQKIIRLMQEWFGVALLGTSVEDLPRALRKALFLWGPPRTGKSTILNVLKRLIGTHNIVSSSVQDVTARQFGLQNFLGKDAWITEEVSALSKMTDPTRLKCLITGEELSVDRKMKSPVELRFAGPVAWAANSAPNISESSDALYSRVLTVEVDHVFDEKTAQAKFGAQKPEAWLEENGEFPGILNWAIEGYKRAARAGRYSEIPELEQSREEWRARNDPIYAFVQEHCSYDPEVQTESKALSWTAMGFASAQGWDKLKYRAIANEVAGAVRSLFPNVERPQLQHRGSRKYFWRGLRIGAEGQKYLDLMAAKDPNAMASFSGINQPTTFGSDDDGEHS